MAIALGAFASCVAVMFVHGFGPAEPDVRDGDAVGVALAAAMTLPLVARRRRPLAVFALAASAMVGIHALGYPGELGLWPALSVYAVSAYAPTPRAGRIGGLVAGAVFAVLGAIAVIVDPDPGIVAGAVTWAGAWVAGDVARERRRRLGDLQEGAERAERDAERERRLAAAEERTRIARELHDSAGHALNVILVQAGAARLLQERDPTGARDALETIDSVARGTLGEIERLVAALRDESAADPLAPQPGLAALDELLDQHRASGLDVTICREGEPRRLDAGVDRAAYRIVQEALTNAARHGDGDAAVTLRFGAHGLEIAVSNPTSTNGQPERGGGHGLVGMRERAALLGGELFAGRDGDRFRVETTLPYGGRPQR